MANVFTWQVNAGAILDKEPRVSTAAFGDGYQQRVARGINFKPRKFSIECTRKRSEMEAIEAFLDARGGVQSFTWKPPVGAEGKWICRAWQAVSLSVNVGQLTATFEEVFGD